ncbi:MAG: hypothetical protein CSA49_06590 [Gammaproteobacteria bacterium]|nr:MAG: hypothetical protein CSA49_06590 [Gammaproteobacteria bacterium]
MTQPVKPDTQAGADQLLEIHALRHSGLMRIPLAVVFGLLVSMAVLLLMQSLVIQRKAIASHDYDFDVIEFVRLKKDTDVDTRERRIPEKPKPPEKLQPQKIDVAMNQDLSNADFEFDLPKMDLPRSVTGGPRLGGLMNHSTGSSDSSVIPLVRIQPQYPRRAAMNGTQGEVIVGFTITPAGTVKDVSIIEAKPRGVFERAAKRAILKWKFKPKFVDGKAVSQQAQQKLVFKLNG